MKAGVIGHPIAHSKSPIIQRYWRDQYGIEGSYEAIDIAPENLKNGIKKLIDENYNGFSVTIPHKRAMVNLCDEIDETAHIIGAVNSVKIIQGKLYGKNTDAFGFIQNIKSSSNLDFKNKTACVLGAGGASRAIIYGLMQEGVTRIILTNRTIETAHELAQDFGNIIDVVSWEKRSELLNDIDILVNTTCLGMVGKLALDINLRTLSTQALVCDIVYTPLMTELLKEAQDRGNPIVTGIGMLLHQARPAFAAWTGIMPEVTTELKGLVLK
jgi:shikimate dehydrogenase